MAREVGTEGKLGGQATVQGVAGTWKDLTDNVNTMAFNVSLFSRFDPLALPNWHMVVLQLTQQVRTISSATVSFLAQSPQLYSTERRD